MQCNRCHWCWWWRHCPNVWYCFISLVSVHSVCRPFLQIATTMSWQFSVFFSSLPSSLLLLKKSTIHIFKLIFLLGLAAPPSWWRMCLERKSWSKTDQFPHSLWGKDDVDVVVEVRVMEQRLGEVDWSPSERSARTEELQRAAAEKERVIRR